MTAISRKSTNTPDLSGIRGERRVEDAYTTAWDTLERAGWKADYVITHCAPTSIAQRMDRHYQPDKLTDFLETVCRRCQFGQWFCGHYHVNQVIDDRFVVQ